LIAHSNNSNAVGGNPIGSALPTRVITYAWGEHYLDILLSLTIPALLAPGNLPYVAASTSCELVILTEERFFAEVSAHPSVTRAKQLCFVRLIALDDLISRKDAYGIALTYALHRGFSDLGPAMTESWQLFLNADFILAEGSLRSVISRLAQGERLVASPSYCVDAFAVIPELRKQVRKGMGRLAISPRELAAIALTNRHNTVRGKTINQSEFTLRLMDQFYWLVDDHTLLGHQMPIAIVGMRPERYVSEPNAYWDHGFMREYCPQAKACVIGDSDEFLMLELREKNVAQELIESGRPPPKIIAERMITFLTPYQRNFARFELTLHSGKIPPEAATARERLHAYVDEVLSHLPAFLPSHIEHPQWNYHLPGFVEFRHKFLSERLGALTETLAPPVFLSKLDRAWWKLDGMEKRAARRRAELRDFVYRELRLLEEAANALERVCDPSTAARLESESKLAAIRDRLALRHSAIAGEIDKYCNRDGLALIGVALAHLQDPSSRAEHQHCSDMQKMESRQCSREINAIACGLSELYQRGIRLIDLELELPRNEYRLMMPRRLASAAIPHVEIEGVSGEPKPKGLLGTLYDALFRHLSRRILQPLSGTIAPALQNGDARILQIGTASGVPATILNGGRGRHVRLLPAAVMTGNLEKAFDTPPVFDLCVCDLNFAELVELPRLVAMIRPFMADRGVISSFHLKEDLVELPPDREFAAEFPAEDVVRIHHVGSWRVAVMLRILRRLRNLSGSWAGYRFLAFVLRRLTVRIGLLVLVAPIALLVRPIQSLRKNKPIVKTEGRSIVIEILLAGSTKDVVRQSKE
jgi:hypothetical protein